MENLKVGKVLGRGAYGVVYAAHDLCNQRPCVLKRVRYCKENSKERASVDTEINIMKKFTHANIVHCYAFFIDPRQEMLSLVLEYCSKGDMYECIQRQNGKHFTERDILIWFHQMLLGLDHIHKEKIIHRDIKTKNIFLTKYNVVKIGDFGCSRALKTMELAKSFVGTPCYMAPELGVGKPYDYKTDVWALGCVLYEITCLKPPFDAPNLYLLSKAIRKGEYGSVPELYSEDLRGLIKVMLSVEPDARPSTSQILGMNFINKTLADIFASLIAHSHKNWGLEDSVDLMEKINEPGSEVPIDLLESLNDSMQAKADEKVKEMEKKIEEEQSKVSQIMNAEDFKQTIQAMTISKVQKMDQTLPPVPSTSDLEFNEDGIIVPNYLAGQNAFAGKESPMPDDEDSSSSNMNYSEFGSPSSECSMLNTKSPQPPSASLSRLSPSPRNASMSKKSPQSRQIHEQANLKAGESPQFVQNSIDSAAPHLKPYEQQFESSIVELERLHIERGDLLCATSFINENMSKLKQVKLKPQKDLKSPTKKALSSPRQTYDASHRDSTITSPSKPNGVAIAPIPSTTPTKSPSPAKPRRSSKSISLFDEESTPERSSLRRSTSRGHLPMSEVYRRDSIELKHQTYDTPDQAVIISQRRSMSRSSSSGSITATTKDYQNPDPSKCYSEGRVSSAKRNPSPMRPTRPESATASLGASGDVKLPPILSRHLNSAKGGSLSAREVYEPTSGRSSRSSDVYSPAFSRNNSERSIGTVGASRQEPLMSRQSSIRSSMGFQS